MIWNLLIGACPFWEVKMSGKKKVCMICGKPSEVTICDSCKAQIQGEALDKKQKIEKQVRIGPEVEKDREVRKREEKK
jgi:hypothetical protein